MIQVKCVDSCENLAFQLEAFMVIVVQVLTISYIESLTQLFICHKSGLRKSGLRNEQLLKPDKRACTP